MKYLCIFVLWAITATVQGSDEVSTAIDHYFEDFNRGMPALELVHAHWHPESVVFTSDAVKIFDGYKESASWVQEIQVSIAEDGWVRSEVVESAVCNLGDTLALYSMKFKRVFSDGREIISGGTYTLAKSDRWRIASVIFANPDDLVRCDNPDA